jgi:hypothetical protein
MFRMARYLLLLKLFQRVKANLIAAAVSLLLLAVSMLVMGDVVAVADASERSALLLFKWVLVLLFLLVMGCNAVKILKAALSPFASEKPLPDPKRERILGKERLRSRKELIFDKYEKRGE